MRYVLREPLAKVLQTEIERRGEGGQIILAREISANGRMTYETAQRRLYSILNPEYTNSRSGKRLEQKIVMLETADEILTALWMQDVWHVELADAFTDKHHDQPAEPRKPIPRSTVCRGCGCDFSERTKGCVTCNSRVYRRRDRSKRVLASRPGSGGLSADTFGCGTGENRADPAPPHTPAGSATPSLRKAA